jgi:lipopolysaccharide transport system ATP-binding protein
LAKLINLRWYARIRGKEDPFLRIGETNDRSTKGESDIVWSLKDLNFEIEQGDAVGIIGRNGAGKSTLLKILSKVTAPTTGKLVGQGRIASLLEVGTGFHPELSGRENIFLNGAILGMRKKEIERKFDEIVDFAGIERYIDTPVKRYSSGMYVRLAFAVAAHLESEILIVDEVLAVGDAEFQKKCLGKMGEVSKGEGRTVLFVSHNIEAVNNLCNSVILMDEGKIQYKGSVDAGYLLYQQNVQSELKSFFITPFSHELVKYSAYITSIQLINLSHGDLAVDESLKFVVKVKANETISNHRIGIRVSTADEKPVGLLFTTSSISVNNEDEVEVHVVLNNHNLAKGSYSLDFSLGLGNEEAAIKDIHIISNAITLQITKKHYNSVNKISNWNKLNWGNCNFNDVITTIK